MLLKEWNKLPENIKNEKVKKYYIILNRKKISLICKRIFDIIISFLMLVLISPILFIIAILIKIDSKGPIFYRQVRVTAYGKKFKIFKFRTMVVDADKKGSLVTKENDDRITDIGKKIRKLRIDELPQLINVLIGDMSFVGTRPEVEKYVDKYTDEMKATLLMPAGITSRASIEYKDEDEIISKYLKQNENIDDIYINRVLPEKMKFNLSYIEKFNFIEDIKIICKTASKVFFKGGNF